MDLRNWEFYEDNLPLVGATVKVRDAVLTHPNAGTVLATTTTDSNGMWAFTGLTDTAKDVEVIWGSVSQYHRWIKGMTRHTTGAFVFTEDVRINGALTLIGGLTLPAGSVETADLAANAVTKIHAMVVGSGTVTTTSGVYVDMTDMDSGDFTSAGGDLLVWFGSVVNHTLANNYIYIALAIDGGGPVADREIQTSAAGEIGQLLTFHRYTASAGTHRIKGRWLTAAATASALSSMRSLMVLELKR